MGGSCGHESNLEQPGHVKVGLPYGWCGAKEAPPTPAAATISRPRLGTSVGLAVEDCCSPRWPTRCEALWPEEGSRRDSGGLCRELTQVWGAGKGDSGEDAAGCQEVDSTRWAEQEPDPEQVPVLAEECVEAAAESQTQEQDVAEMRRLTIELFKQHEGAGTRVPIEWAQEHVAGLFSKYEGLERELYTRVCRKYGEVPLARYAEVDDSAGSAERPGSSRRDSPDDPAKRCQGREEKSPKGGR